VSKTRPKLVVIGGGTGSFTLLSSLKHFEVDLTALVNMSDDGGSTGILRDELGVLPPGDVRQCLVALSTAPKVRELFNYRFDNGSLKGHSFGNLFLSAMEKMTESFEEAISLADELLQVQGTVLPITTENSKLVLTNSEGIVTKGEYRIGSMHFDNLKRPDISLEPEACITEKAKHAILEADMIVIAPGNLYGSLAPALVVKGVGSALAQSKGRVVYVCNLVTKPGQTDGFMAHDYAAEIERFAKKTILDFLIYNTDDPTEAMLKKYTRDGEFMVDFDLDEMNDAHYTAVGLPLIDTRPVKHVAHDTIAQSRSLIRHNAEAVSKELMNILGVQ